MLDTCTSSTEMIYFVVRNTARGIGAAQGCPRHARTPTEPRTRDFASVSMHNNYALCTNYVHGCSGHANARSAPHNPPGTHANAIAGHRGEPHARQSGSLQVLRERRLWRCASSLRSRLRRSCKREQHESFRTASVPAHQLLERGNRTHDGRTMVET